MSLLINNCAIVDREYEAKRIAQLLRDSVQNISHVIILCADSGYGKSSIMYKVKEIYNDLSNQIVIVNTPPTNSNMAPMEGQYLNYIAEALNDKLKPRYSLNAIKIRKKRTPGTSGKMVPGGIFLHCFVWDIAQIAAVFP